MVNRFASLNTALTLKVIGIVCILSYFVDFATLLLDVSFSNKQSQIIFATALVDRGIVPMLGLGALFAGYWVESVDGAGDRPKSIDLRLPSLILSSILGLMFLLIFPLHLNNVRQASTQTVNQIAEDADKAENQLKNQLSQLQAQIGNDQGKAQLEQVRSRAKAQLTEILKDEQKYQQTLQNPQIAPAVKEALKKAKTNPEELDKFIAQQTDIQEIADQKLVQIRQRKEEAEKKARESAWKSGLRTGITSLLLFVGYVIIGWTGLKGAGALQTGKRQAPLR